MVYDETLEIRHYQHPTAFMIQGIHVRLKVCCQTDLHKLYGSSYYSAPDSTQQQRLKETHSLPLEGVNAQWMWTKRPGNSPENCAGGIMGKTY
jgi:hypothetical protein